MWSLGSLGSNLTGSCKAIMVRIGPATGFMAGVSVFSVQSGSGISAVGQDQK